MTDVKIDRPRHDCGPPHVERPAGVLGARVRWRCPVCGQRWVGTVGLASVSWQAKGRPSILWEARQRAAMKRNVA